MRILPTALAAGLALTGLTACAGSGSGTSYDVTAGDDTCKVSDTDLTAGEATFKVTNEGSEVTEVYVYGKEGAEFTKIVGEKENIGPGTSQSFSVSLSAGQYEVACKPGMKGDGIRTRVTVTGGSGGEASEAAYDKELEFEIAADGKVTAPGDLSAAAGDKVEFKAENKAGEEYYLEVRDAQGNQVGRGPAEAKADGELVAELKSPGSYRVLVYPQGRESEAQEFTVSVG